MTALNNTAAVANTIPLEFSQDYTPGNIKSAMQGVKSGDLWKVPVAKLHRMPGLNVRVKTDEYAEHVKRLAQSMVVEGYYPDKPMAVFINEDGRIMVRDGYSRLDAVEMAIGMGAQIEEIPCVTAPKGTSMVDITVGLVKSNTGKPLMPIEVAAVCKRLVNWGWDTKKISERLDYTERYIDELLGLLAAPEALVKLVSAGKVSASTAMEVIKKRGASKASETIVEAAKTAPKGKVTNKVLKAAAPAPVVSGDTPKKVKPKKTAKQDAPKVEESPNGPAVTALNAVYDDPGFKFLSDAVQQLVLEQVDA